MISLTLFRDRPLLPLLTRFISARVWEYRPSLVFCACAFTLVSSLLLGGGTRGGFLSDALLQLLAIPALLVAISGFAQSRALQVGARRDVPWIVAFCCAIALVPLLQLVPLPPFIWTRLPGHDEVARLVGLLGGDLPWLPISLSPSSTWISWLSLLPPMALFIAAVQLGHAERRHLSLLIVAVGVGSVFIGLTQVAQGQSSPLRFFSVTNPTEAVGFFANRNHFAALLYAVLLFAAAWGIDLALRIQAWTDWRILSSARAAALTAFFLTFIIVIAGEAMARSRAGLALTMAALVAAFGLAFVDRRRVTGSKATKFLLAAVIVAVLLSLQFALYRILDRFGADPLEQARGTFRHVTISAASAFMPFGSGSGTFVPVYQMFERPADLIPGTYVNHAHDDFLEIWLETGIVGPVLICMFLAWWGITSFKWWWKPPTNVPPFDLALVRAATVVIGLLLVHSVVDYPLRTAAIMGMFAMCCAFLIEPLGNSDVRAPAFNPARAEDQRRRWPKREAAIAELSAATVAAHTRPASAPTQRWGEGIEWPAQWSVSEQQEKPQATEQAEQAADPLEAIFGNEPKGGG